VRILTWNVNSVRVRAERLVGVLERHRPDVACLQELKTTDEQFPHEAVATLGYHAAIHGQKTYNGVAILSLEPPEGVVRGFDDGGEDDGQARLISASVGGVRVYSAYVPNGGEVGSDKFAYKLAWLERARAVLEAAHASGEPLVFAGDMNVAPRDSDVAFPDRWRDTTHCVPEARGALHALQSLGLVDVFAQRHPEGGVYSWWDYRRLAFPKGDGLRIDLILASRALADACQDARVDREERKGKQPSDHAPVLADFAWERP